MRTGLMAQALLAKGHRVTWWKSTFEHASKTHYIVSSDFEEVEPGLTIAWIHSRGYRRHVSLSRALDHRDVGIRFKRKASSRLRPEVVVCSLPIPELSAAGVDYSVRLQIPVVVDIRDWWPDALLYTLPASLRGIAKLALSPYSGLVNRSCRSATAITGITPPFVDWGLRHARRPRTAFDRDFPHGYQRSAVSEDRLTAGFEYWAGRGLDGANNGIVVSFIGSLSRSFRLEPILKAAYLLQISHRPVTFVFCGDGDQLNSLRRAAFGLDNVIFSGEWVGSTAIEALLTLTDLGLVPLPTRPDFLATVNNKTVEYLSAGVPIVVSPEESWVAHLTKRHELGVSWDGQNAESLVYVMSSLLESPDALRTMSKKALAYFMENFEAEKVYGQYTSFLEELVGSVRGRERAV